MADNKPAAKQIRSKNINGSVNWENEAETESYGKRISGKTVAVYLVIGLAAFAALSYYFNFWGFKTKIVEFFRTQDAEYQTLVAGYEESKREYEQRTAELNEKEKSLAAREQQLQEQEAASTGSATSASGDRDVTAAADIFENMDKNAAAEIFNNTTNDAWIAKVLSTIDEKKAAQILGAMDPAKASAVSSYLS